MRGLYSIRPWFVARLRGVADRLVAKRVPADAVTYAGLAVSLVAGGLIAAGALLGQPLLWLAVPPLVLVRLACNALDGVVARRTRTARPFGAVLNEVCDRAADAAVIAPTAFVAGAGAGLGATAAAFAVSCTGVLSQAATGTRDTRGPMGKADRMAAIAIASIAALFWRPAWLAIDMLIILGAVATVGTRLDRVRKGVESRVIPFPAEKIVEVLAPAPFEEEMASGLGR